MPNERCINISHLESLRFTIKECTFESTRELVYTQIKRLQIPRGNAGAQKACISWITLIQAGSDNGIVTQAVFFMANWEGWSFN